MELDELKILDKCFYSFSFLFMLYFYLEILSAFLIFNLTFDKIN